MRLPTFGSVLARLTALIACAALVAGCGSDDPESAAPLGGQAGAGAGGRAARRSRRCTTRRTSCSAAAGTPSRRASQGLKGYPVVVNKWASWCPPCRAEFPYFQSQAIKRGKEVAFLGVDGNDNDADAKEFLAARSRCPSRATRTPT